MKPFSEADIKAALFSIPSHKSPGPVGYNSGFFKATWDIVGTDITKAILGFFEHRNPLKEWRNTRITLIPKCANPANAADYRLIACCNTLYKCISKMLCNRLRSILPILVHDNQTAFIEGRYITHNVMICQHLIRLYKRKNISPRCLLKIDLREAYDSIPWDFIGKLLPKLKFPLKFCD